RTEIYPLSLHDALPISIRQDILIDSRNSNVRSRFDWQTRISPRNSLLDCRRSRQKTDRCPTQSVCVPTCCRSFHAVLQTPGSHSDRKSTRLNSSHVKIS